ncbi:hypothetical protein HDU76_012404 [Blyttiomyces sp. JEL0837]|nr:hypothetical protein HDU76_012404 [Blyttiomyces sp. JEL0837]
MGADDDESTTKVVASSSTTAVKTTTTTAKQDDEQKNQQELVHQALQILLCLNALVDHTTPETYHNLLSTCKATRQHWYNYQCYKRAPHLKKGRQHWVSGRLDNILINALKENDIDVFTGTLYAIPETRYHTPKWQTFLGRLLRRASALGYRCIVKALLDKPYDQLQRFGTEEEAILRGIRHPDVVEVIASSGRIQPLDFEKDFEKYMMVIKALQIAVSLEHTPDYVGVVPALLKLFKHGFDCNEYDGFNMLKLAAKAGRTKVVELLLAVGADPNGPSDNQLPLFHAIQYSMNKTAADNFGRKSTDRVLVSAGVSVFTNAEIVALAASNGLMHVVQAAIDAGFRIDQRLKRAHYVAARKESLPMLKLLLANTFIISEGDDVIVDADAKSLDFGSRKLKVTYHDIVQGCFRIACKSGAVDVVEHLLRLGADPANGIYQNAVHGSTKVFRLLRNAGVSLGDQPRPPKDDDSGDDDDDDDQDYDSFGDGYVPKTVGEKILLLAAANKRVDLMETVIREGLDCGGVDVNAGNGQIFKSVCLWPAKTHQTSITRAIRALIGGGLDLTVPAISTTVLAICGRQNTDALKELAKLGIDIDYDDSKGLVEAVSVSGGDSENGCRCTSCWKADTLEYLLALGVDFGLWKRGHECVMAALKGDNTRALRILVNAGVDLNCHEGIEIVTAATKSDLGFVNILIDGGARVDGEQGSRALMSTIQDKRWNNAMALVSHGAVVDDAAIIFAVATGDLDVLTHLVQFGADVCGQDNAALIIAVSNNDERIVRKLIAFGADVNAQDGRAVLLAFELGFNEVLRTLLDAGAYGEVLLGIL